VGYPNGGRDILKIKNMTPKEKAKQLYFKMHSQEHIISKEAKQCALIAVDEILEDNRINYMLLGVGIGKHYWQEVKQEIEKL
jgi:hypothetical protein